MLLDHLILFSSILYGITAQAIKMEPSTVSFKATDVSSGSGDVSIMPVDVSLGPVDEAMTSTRAPSVQVNCSNETQWKCGNDECISLEQKCDGTIDCMDASDEYLDLCNGSSRHMFGLVLHCSFSCSAWHDQLCPQVCCHEPEYCYYALMAESGEPDTCRLPNYPEHGKYAVKPTVERVDWAVRSDRPDFWLNYTCDRTYVLMEGDRVECKNGTWSPIDKPPYCSEACPLNRNLNFTYQCPKGMNNSVPCDEYVAIETMVLVSRVQQPQTQPKPDDEEPSQPVALHMLCRQNKTFNLTTDCVDEVDKLQKDFENPVLEKMTEYETKFNNFAPNETTYEFGQLVDEFHVFEELVKGNLSMMHQKAEECDISLDLLIWYLTEKQLEDIELL